MIGLVYTLIEGILKPELLLPHQSTSAQAVLAEMLAKLQQGQLDPAQAATMLLTMKPNTEANKKRQAPTNTSTDTATGKRLKVQPAEPKSQAISQPNAAKLAESGEEKAAKHKLFRKRLLGYMDRYYLNK